MGGVALPQVEGDDSVQVAGDDLSVSAGEQVECETAGTVAHLDRQLELVEPKEQPALGGLGNPVLGEPDGVPVSRPSPCQGAAEAQAGCRGGIGDPVTSAAVEVCADGVIGVDSDHGALSA